MPPLRAAPGLTAVTLLAEIQRCHPGCFGNGVLRTLQRRVRQWRALEGEERKVFFAQAHEPGRLGLSAEHGSFADVERRRAHYGGQSLEPHVEGSPCCRPIRMCS